MAYRTAAAPRSHYPIHHAQPQPVWAGPRLPNVRRGSKDRRKGLELRREPRGTPVIKAWDPCGHGSGCSCCCWLTPEGDGGERGSLVDVGKWEPATFVQEHKRTHTHTHTFTARSSLINLLKPTCLLIILNLALHRQQRG